MDMRYRLAALALCAALAVGASQAGCAPMKGVASQAGCAPPTGFATSTDCAAERPGRSAQAVQQSRLQPRGDMDVVGLGLQLRDARIVFTQRSLVLVLPFE